jgi:hypothetical protein
MARPKKDGGLGFRDLHLFNLVMLARQTWCLLTAPDSLCARVLQERYFPNQSILNATSVRDMSYTWRSILKGVEVIKLGGGEYLEGSMALERRSTPANHI